MNGNDSTSYLLENEIISIFCSLMEICYQTESSTEFPACQNLLTKGNPTRQKVLESAIWHSDRGAALKSALT